MVLLQRKFRAHFRICLKCWQVYERLSVIYIYTYILELTSGAYSTSDLELEPQTSSWEICVTTGVQANKNYHFKFIQMLSLLTAKSDQQLRRWNPTAVNVHADHSIKSGTALLSPAPTACQSELRRECWEAQICLWLEDFKPIRIVRTSCMKTLSPNKPKNLLSFWLSLAAQFES